MFIIMIIIIIILLVVAVVVTITIIITITNIITNPHQHIDYQRLSASSYSFILNRDSMSGHRVAPSIFGP